MALAGPARPSTDQEFAGELERLLLARLDAYERMVKGIVGALDESKAGLRNALRLVRSYPEAVRASYSRACEDSGPRYRGETARNHLKQLHERVEIVDDLLLRAVEADIPPVLSMAVERECRLLDLPRTAVVTVGPADNYTAYVQDLEAWLLHGLTLPEGYALPESRQEQFALLQVPRLEAASSLWRPIVLGHEVAHLVVVERAVVEGLDWAAFPEDDAEKVDPPPWAPDRLHVKELRECAQRWSEELVCDAYATLRFGPAAVVAITSFLHTAHAHAFGATHPPGWLRAELMLRWLEGTPQALTDLLGPWQHGVQTPATVPPWVELLAQLMRDLAPGIEASVRSWNVDSYDATARSVEISHVELQLRSGFPAVEDASREGATLLDVDVLNGAWLAARARTHFPVERLADYSLEALEFLQQWSEASADDHADADLEPRAASEAAEQDGALSEDAIRSRLAAPGDNRLVITPLLAGAIKGAAVDLRLGNKFVLFRSSRIEAFNPLDPSVEPRAMQTYAEKAWGQPFVLHPNELVLANVLEYVHLPADLMGVVATRSSYGRLGLVTATATLVHPHYRGSLTLELVNLSQVPLSLTPGQRVAQLVLHKVAPAAPEPPTTDKYHCPTSPEFSKVHLDRDQLVLREMRKRTSDRGRG